MHAVLSVQLAPTGHPLWLTGGGEGWEESLAPARLLVQDPIVLWVSADWDWAKGPGETTFLSRCAAAWGPPHACPTPAMLVGQPSPSKRLPSWFPSAPPVLSTLTRLKLTALDVRGVAGRGKGATERKKFLLRTEASQPQERRTRSPLTLEFTEKTSLRRNPISNPYSPDLLQHPSLLGASRDSDVTQT